jgi:hypothetical protein
VRHQRQRRAVRDDASAPGTDDAQGRFCHIPPDSAEEDEDSVVKSGASEYRSNCPGSHWPAISPVAGRGRLRTTLAVGQPDQRSPTPSASRGHAGCIDGRAQNRRRQKKHR